MQDKIIFITLTNDYKAFVIGIKINVYTDKDLLEIEFVKQINQPTPAKAQASKTNLILDALYWASFNRFELRMPGRCVEDCSHSGQCDSDVAAWVEKIRTQIETDDFKNKPTPDKIRAELAEYGAWDETELADDAANLRRLIWIAAGNIAEDATPDCSEPLKLNPVFPSGSQAGPDGETD